jgi:hypothetical protein
MTCVRVPIPMTKDREREIKRCLSAYKIAEYERGENNWDESHPGYHMEELFAEIDYLRLLLNGNKDQAPA